MDPGDPFIRWDPRSSAPATSAPHQHRLQVHPAEVELDRPRDLSELFHGYGVRPLTVSRIAEMGFTPSTLAGMRDEELDDMMSTLSHLFRWDLLVGERYGIKASIRAERRRLESLLLLHHHHHHEDPRRRLHDQPLDALSQEGLSEEPMPADSGKGKQLHRGNSSKRKTKKKKKEQHDQEEEDQDSESETASRDGTTDGSERQREHPFIVTEPGEVARAKKNGLDYLFHLYEQCREFLHQAQAMAKDTGDKCPTKVTNQVFRYAKRMGASYINKPKMRHYVHCYALHCLDEEVSNELRRGFKERGENVGAWRQACYKPLVDISARHGWDIDAVFNAHPRLSIWYVPTKLRQMCHLARSNAAVRPVPAGLLPPPTTTVAQMF